MIDRVFHNYRIEEELGRGGWATVYRGHDLKLDRPVAVKVLSQQFALDPARIKRFRNEAKTLARLRHDNIVLVHDYIEADDSTHLIVMEYVDGGSLSELLRRRGRLDEPALGLGWRMAAGPGEDADEDDSQEGTA